MNTARFDRISKLFAARRAAVQEATPGVEPEIIAPEDAFDLTEKTFYLFVQSFQSGSVTPKAGEEGTYTVTLEGGLGQTVYFADRPGRNAGAVPTPQFLDGLGFGPDNPPNAALVVESAVGGTEIAVVELRNPTYETVGNTATYDIRALPGAGFTPATVEPAAFPAAFDAAHLFIDDCPMFMLSCYEKTVNAGTNPKLLKRVYPIPGCFALGTLWCEPCVVDYQQYTTPSEQEWATEQCQALVPFCEASPQLCYARLEAGVIPANASPQIG